MWPWEQEDDDHALPRWHHWLLAATMLIVLSAVMPIVAAFS
ncbi:hypothetical protein EBBID32_30970 [Sphingobium indicum BiD32]|uniref:Uncharacterized protein n=1 Tax=Sphingobium indicum BiD32 TaxID=1301087 RepID=N1MSV7_9SPHN|nr:hypothetical protein EBBID32_30970 [Sphingobium indicum BiD32]